jgi:TonB family protein
MISKMIRGILLFTLLLPGLLVAQAPQTPSTPATKKPDDAMKGTVEIVSDTRGVDFGPYLKEAVKRIKKHWSDLVPDVARPPVRKTGTVIIQFAIMKSGAIQGLLLQQPSGDTALDRAAWNGITKSTPLAPLPINFSGAYLALRMKFVYNPKQDSVAPDTAPPTQK